MTESPFSGIIIGVLVIAALSFAIGSIIDDAGQTYGQEANDTVFANITASGRTITATVNETQNNFFGNKTTNTQQSAVDRLVGTAYGTILVMKDVPVVFVNIVSNSTTGIGISGYTAFIIGAVIAIIVGIAIWLAVGRR